MDHSKRETVLVLPSRRFRAQGLKLLAGKESWLQAQWQALPAPMPFMDGGAVLLRGQKIPVRIIKGRCKPVVSQSELIVSASHSERAAARIRAAFIELARADLQNAVMAHARSLNVTPARISVRDTRSRWGSCSQSGNLNFSWRLVCAPPEVLSYVAAHEVAHLKEANHSRQFWNEVGKLIPDHNPARAYLRSHAAKLFAVGAEI